MGAHVINRQVFDIRISRGLDAFDIQHRAGDYYYQKVLPALDQIFDELTSDQTSIEIERLEIDLGVISASDIEANIFNSEHFRLLKESITKELARLAEKSLVKSFSSDEQAVRQWLFYMEYGFLKWNTLQVNDAWYQLVLEALATNFGASSELRQLILKNKDALRRIANDHSVDFLANLLTVLAARKMKAVKSIVDELIILVVQLLKEQKRMSYRVEEIRQNMWEQVFRLVAEDKPALRDIERIERQLIADQIKYYNIKVVPDSLLSQIPHIKNQLRVLLKAGSEQLINHSKTPGDSDKTEAKGKEKSDNKDDIKDEAIFVQSAGLVLLHPFLTILFNRLSLTIENSFTDIDAQHKAIQLLHYLANGSIVGKDYELALPKLICGFPVSKPIVPDVLNEEEIEEANNLLAVVIEKWDKLGNTSVQALRESFLQRKGKLSRKNDQWYLQVETNSLDVLLDFLPWSRSIIKLPWMKEMIRVEWR